MNDESQTRNRLRQRTLAEFDRALVARRIRSRAGAGSAALVLICATAVILTREEEQIAPVSTLPAFVQIIETDDELLEALRDAGRCEGIMRQGAIVTLIACDLGS